MIEFTRRTTLAGLIGAVFASRAARADDGIAPASALIEGLATRALAVLRRGDLGIEEREGQFRAILSEGFDLAFIGRFVLGQHWQAADAGQRDEYQALFAEFVLRTYSSRFGGYAGETFTVTGARRASEKDVVVACAIGRQGAEPIVTEWRVRTIDGSPRIIDVAVEGISMALNQRQEFDSVIAQYGVAGLIAMLRARVSKSMMASG